MKPKAETQEVEISNQLDESIIILIIAFIVIPFSLLFIYLLNIKLKKFFKIKRRINIDRKHLIKKPFLPVDLSILFPGFGQISTREIDRGVIYIILTISTYLILFITLAVSEEPDLTGDLNLTAATIQVVYLLIKLISISFLVFVYINSIIDTYQTAMVINRKILRIVRQIENYLMDWMKLGRALYNDQCYQDAVELYTTIISILPTYALAHYNRAVIYYKIHDVTKARIDFLSAAKLGHKKAQRILKAEMIVKSPSNSVTDRPYIDIAD